MFCANEQRTKIIYHNFLRFIHDKNKIKMSNNNEIRNDENSTEVEHNTHEGSGDKHLVASAFKSPTSHRASGDQSPSPIFSPEGRDVLINTEIVSLKRVMSDSEEDRDDDDEEEEEEEEEDQANGEDQSDDEEEVIKAKPKKKKKYSYSVRDRQMQRFPVKVSWLCLICLNHLHVFERI